MKRISTLLVFLWALVLGSTSADATSQWSRKYGVACTTCHTAAFPRLNYYGERFMRNGYQDIGSQDGDTAGKQGIGDRLFIEELGNLLGVRLNVVPLRVTTNALEQEPGTFSDRAQIGNADWLQLFTAGSVFKNVSIFVETEFTSSGDLHNSWFRFGFHNLAGGRSYLNAWVGIMDPLELHVASGRLPMIPPARQQAFLVRSSGGTGDDSIDIRTGRPAFALFGEVGPLVYEIGVDNGRTLEDPNDYKNGWATLRLERRAGWLEGSAVSVFGYGGTDTKKLRDVTDTFIGTVRNRFWRVSPGMNLRWGGLDLIGAYVFGTDDNWGLASSGGEDEAQHHAVFAQVGHPLGKWLHLAAQWDGVWSDDAPALRLQRVAAAISFQPRENWRVIVMPRADVLSKSITHPRRQHELAIMIRTML